MRKVLYALFLAMLIYGVWSIPSPQADATHDTIYSPCSTEYGYIHMTYDEWAAHIATLEAEGTIPLDIVFRRSDGLILSIDDWLNGDYPEIEELNFAAGKVPEWILDANRVIRRVDDPYWAQPNPLTPSFTVWGTLCMANLEYSIPLMEINDDGVWESNLPTTTTTTEAPVTTTTTTVVPATTTTQPPTPTTTMTIPVDPAPEPPEDEPQPLPEVVVPDGYDLWDAEYEGWPFEQTIILLEDRYPPGTPDRFHFRLSAAVEFLRQGGMIGGLDFLWDSNG